MMTTQLYQHISNIFNLPRFIRSRSFGRRVSVIRDACSKMQKIPSAQVMDLLASR